MRWIILTVFFLFPSKFADFQVIAYSSLVGKITRECVDWDDRTPLSSIWSHRDRLGIPTRSSELATLSPHVPWISYSFVQESLSLIIIDQLTTVPTRARASFPGKCRDSVDSRSWRSRRPRTLRSLIYKNLLPHLEFLLCFDLWTVCSGKTGFA